MTTRLEGLNDDLNQVLVRVLAGGEGKRLDPVELKAAREDPATQEDIDRGIREEVLNTAFGRESGYRAALETDPQLQKALTLFPEAEKLVASRAAARKAAAKPKA